MSKFDYDCFYGDYNSIGFNADKYSKEEALKIGSEEYGCDESELTVEEAYIEHTKRKKEAIEKLANEYKNIIPKEVYSAVVAYEFRIENDKNYRKCF